MFTEGTTFRLFLFRVFSVIALLQVFWRWSAIWIDFCTSILTYLLAAGNHIFGLVSHEDDNVPGYIICLTFTVFAHVSMSVHWQIMHLCCYSLAHVPCKVIYGAKLSQCLCVKDAVIISRSSDGGLVEWGRLTIDITSHHWRRCATKEL